jgi:hypothetical protein
MNAKERAEQTVDAFIYETNTNLDSYPDLKKRVVKFIEQAIQAAEQAERERCAKIADKHYAAKDVTLSPSWYSACFIIANEIREQGDGK